MTVRTPAIVALLFGGWAVMGLGFGLDDVPPLERHGLEAGEALVHVEPEAAALTVEVDSLKRVLAGLRERGTYVVIDRANNRLWARTTETVRLDAVVSTGSGTILREAGGEQRTWTFDTPAGRHRVLDERRDPVWVKPDWAFLEEGQQPPTSLRDRRDDTALGEWALDLGDGYMIHGTLYERLLGRSTTHGCIRVGRDDLRALVRAIRPGSRVIIF